MSIIAIDRTGVIRCEYDDEVAEIMRDIGTTISVQRASNIEFDNATQGWLVFVTQNTVLDIEEFNTGPFQKREDALRWETKYLGARLCGLSDSEACRIASKEDVICLRS